MATFSEPCGKSRAHRAHSFKRSRLTLRGWITDTYRCKGIKEFGK